ncbi:MAG: dipeptide epimerase [Planctomycetes bacterium]|nr:dipeptide epimerase [Planctomycetota bacterium]
MAISQLKLSTHTFDLPLRHTFTISRESTDVQPTLIVELHDGQHSGYGEATTNSYYGMTLEKMQLALESVRDIVEGQHPLNPEQLWAEVSGPLRDCPFALCALDQAAYDLWGKQQGAPVYQLWGLDNSKTPVSNFTIGIDTVEVMVSKLNEVPDWPIYKIKLGTSNDLEIIRELRKHTSAVFRVDANCGWGVDETIRNSKELKSLNVEFLEQPLRADDWDGHKKVLAHSALPIIADESCIQESDVAACHGHFHGVNIKLVKCGGLTPARRMIDVARELGLKVMVGCMTESTVGISAIAQLLPLLDYVDMDGAALLAQDIATGAIVERGVCRYPKGNGSGVELIAP